jgi:hypothetical protein
MAFPFDIFIFDTRVFGEFLFEVKMRGMIWRFFPEHFVKDFLINLQKV